MAEKLYYGGTILTMEENIYTEAVLTDNGKIKAVGTLEELKARSKGKAEFIHLDGNTMLPGFIDSHSHITGLASTMALVPLNGAKSFEDIINRMKEFKERMKPGEKEWIVGFGYDHNFLEEKRHPDKYVLDRIDTEHPVLVSHASGHMGVMNSKALETAKVTEETEDPQGGRIGRLEGSKEPSGYLEETAFNKFASAMPAPTMEQQIKQLEAAQQVYFSYGVTTLQDGLTKQAQWQILKETAKTGRLKADVVSYIDIRDNAGLLDGSPEYVHNYKGHLKIGGYKLFLDGSPQGRTAWVTEPYEGTEDYFGYPVYKDDEVFGFMEKAVGEEQQIIVHCNGDAAADQMINAYGRAIQKKEKVGMDLRPVMIHAQLVRKDQLKTMAKLGIIGSFFVAHTYYWGDVHIENFGRQRAKNISPVKSAMDAGVVCTFHQDTPVLPPDMLNTLWCSMNRKTKKGIQLAENERVDVMDGLKALTINGAYEYFEENTKGSIREGKCADFVVLDKNPLTVEKEQIKEIHVVQTIKDGEVVYNSNVNPAG